MKRQEVKTAIHKMQRNAINVEEDLATYVDGVGDLWIPPEGKTSIERWIPAHDSDIRVVEACHILGISKLGLKDRERVRSMWYPIPDQLNADLCDGKDPDILTDGSIGFRQSLLSEGWTYKRPRRKDLKRLARDFLNLANTPLEVVAEAVRGFVLRWGPLWCCMEHEVCSWAPSMYSSNWLSRQRQCRWFCSQPSLISHPRSSLITSSEAAHLLNEIRH